MSDFKELLTRLEVSFKKEKEAMKEVVGIHRELLAFYEENPPKKRERQEEDEEQPMQPPKAVATVAPDWQCVGLVMEGLPCPGNYKKPKELERVQIKHDGHLRPCCRGCKNARDRFNNREKKKRKQEEETN